MRSSPLVLLVLIAMIAATEVDSIATPFRSPPPMKKTTSAFASSSLVRRRRGRVVHDSASNFGVGGFAPPKSFNPRLFGADRRPPPLQDFFRSPPPSLLLLASASSEGRNDDAFPSAKKTQLPRFRKRRKRTILATTTVFAAVAALLCRGRLPQIIALLGAIRSFDVKSNLLSLLTSLESLGPTGLILYALALYVWELTAGITTPIETAAGLAFGFRKAALASFVGKGCGAVTGYLLGRFVWSDYAKRRFEGNDMMDLVRESFEHNPLGVCLIWRFSPLPEFAKNYGLGALVPQLRTKHFAGAVLLHGLPFTCLWTALGAETGRTLRYAASTATAAAAGAPPTGKLGMLVTGVTWFGGVVSPTLVGWWIKGLRDKQQERKRLSTNKEEGEEET